MWEVQWFLLSLLFHLYLKSPLSPCLILYIRVHRDNSLQRFDSLPKCMPTVGSSSLTPKCTSKFTCSCIKTVFGMLIVSHSTHSISLLHYMNINYNPMEANCWLVSSLKMGATTYSQRGIIPGTGMTTTPKIKWINECFLFPKKVLRCQAMF